MPNAGAQGTVRVVMHSDLKIVDPIWTTAYIHAQLTATWSTTRCSPPTPNGQVKPQMIEQVTTSVRRQADLHDDACATASLWHDGKPVTAEDCVASIKRWGAKDTMGQKLMTFVKDMPVGRRQDVPDRPDFADRAGARRRSASRRRTCRS